MYTQCTECKHPHSLTIDELRSSQGMIHCNECSLMFNALNHLSEHPIKTTASILSTSTQLPKNISINWNLGVTLCLLVFAFQVYFFEGYRLTQNTTLRPLLTKLCVNFNCTLPVYKNLAEITVLHASFKENTDQYYTFKTAFTNQSDFEQDYPSIKLTLQGFTGDDFAERVFHPTDYLNQQNNKLKPEMSTEITLDIASPSTTMGGYRFELI